MKYTEKFKFFVSIKSCSSVRDIGKCRFHNFGLFVLFTTSPSFLHKHMLFLFVNTDLGYKSRRFDTAFSIQAMSNPLFCVQCCSCNIYRRPKILFTLSDTVWESIREEFKRWHFHRLIIKLNNFLNY